MIRKITGVIVGYIAMVAFVFISFTVLYLILGAEGSFEPETYKVSTVWIVFSIIFSLIAAVLGGYVCMLIAKTKKTAMVLAGIVFVLGIIIAIPALGEAGVESNKVREGSVSNTEAMQNAEQPAITLILNPILGVIGVIAGAGLWREKKVVV
ncbi:MAG: hypothetical protein IH950_01775 [Bacteroidetes bacterium]|nr:hypothetical protein [Bacteroidota bacterium]